MTNEEKLLEMKSILESIKTEALLSIWKIDKTLDELRATSNPRMDGLKASLDRVGILAGKFARREIKR